MRLERVAPVVHAGVGRPDAIERARIEIPDRLRARHREIEQAILARVQAISAPLGAADPEYMEGLRVAVSVALEYGLAAIECAEEDEVPVPEPLLSQARLAANNGVSLDTVVRRYVAGHAVLGDYLMDMVEEDDLFAASVLKRLLRSNAAHFDRILIAVGDEFNRESSRRLDSSEQRRAEHIKRLLAGAPGDTSGLDYSFDAIHLGVIASGPGAAEGLRKLAAVLNQRLLLVHHDESVVWAWIGAHRPLSFDALHLAIAKKWPAQARLALGEPADGLAGWRFTHQQARAAMQIGLRSPGTAVVRYADVALLASILQDELLAMSLHQLYLAPLEQERDEGESLRETLRAYLGAGGNVSSAASALGVSRQTVRTRLRLVEILLGRPLGPCLTEIDVALRIERLNPPCYAKLSGP